MKYKIGDWVWCSEKGKAVIRKIIASNAEGTWFVTTGRRHAVVVERYNIVAPVDPKDIPIEPQKPVGLFDRVCFAIDQLYRGTK